MKGCFCLFDFFILKTVWLDPKLCFTRYDGYTSISERQWRIFMALKLRRSYNKLYVYIRVCINEQTREYVYITLYMCSLTRRAKTFVSSYLPNIYKRTRLWHENLYFTALLWWKRAKNSNHRHFEFHTGKIKFYFKMISVDTIYKITIVRVLINRWTEIALGKLLYI